jgi:hypothetical protein
MRSLITQQFDYVLRRALDQTLGREAAESDSETAEPEGADTSREIEERLRSEFEKQLNLLAHPSLAGASEPFSAAPYSDPEAVDRLKTYPSEEEAVPLLNTLRKLSPLALTLFKRYADQQVRALEGRVPRPSLRGVPGKERIRDDLRRTNLIEPVRDRPGSHRLTPFGREVARLIEAVDEPPAYMADFLQPLDRGRDS